MVSEKSVPCSSSQFFDGSSLCWKKIDLSLPSKALGTLSASGAVSPTPWNCPPQQGLRLASPN